MLRAFVAQTFTYGAVNILSNIISLFAFMVYARFLSVENYGVVGLIGSSVAILTGIAQCGLPNSMQRFYYDKKFSGIDVFQSTLGLLVGLNVLLAWASAVIILLLHYLDFELPYFNLIILALFALPFSAVTNIFIELQRLDFRLFPYFFTKIFMVLSSTSFPIFFLVVLQGGLVGFYIGSTISAVFVCIGMLLYFRENLISFKLDRGLVVELFLFGYPFVFTSIALVLFNTVDKWMLGFFKDVDDVGYYTASEVMIKFLTFVNTAIAMSWAPQVLKLYSYDDQYREKIASLFHLTFVFFIGAAGIFCIFSGDLVELVMPIGYWDMKLSVLILSFGVVGLFLHQMGSVGLSFEKKSKTIARGWVFTTVFNIVLNFGLIPFYGYNGAALSTAISYFLLAYYFFYRSQLVHPFPIDIWRVSWLLVGLFLITLTVYWLDIILELENFRIIILLKFSSVGIFLFLIYRSKLVDGSLFSAWKD